MGSSRTRGKDLVKRLGEGVAVEKVLADLKLSAFEAAVLALKKRAERERRARLELARFQKDLMAAQGVPAALKYLQAVLEGKEEACGLKIKAATALLESLARRVAGRPRGSGPEERVEGPAVQRPIGLGEVKGLMVMLAGMLEGRRQLASGESGVEPARDDVTRSHEDTKDHEEP